MKKISEKDLCRGEWLTLVQSTYLGKDGTAYNWESIRRSGCNGVVVIIARLQPSGRYILIKQFRPAVEGWVLEFPAGLLEKNDAAGQARQELLEETGYTGSVIMIGPPLQVNPATMDLEVRLVIMEVDENLQENNNPNPRPEATEEIEVVLAGDDDLIRIMTELADKGCRISASVYYYFLGRFGAGMSAAGSSGKILQGQE